jgi:hypothetical protein
LKYHRIFVKYNKMSYPTEFDCPITLSIMGDPVMDDIGLTFDRNALLKWLSENQNRHPIVQGRTLMPGQLKTNFALKSQIERYLKETPITNLAPVTTDVFKQLPLTLSAEKFTHRQKQFVNIEVTPPLSGERQPLVMFVAIDNSGSMGENVTDTAEGAGFTRMDLCKHTVRTVVGMLGDRDILCLTTFNTVAKVVMKPTLMTAEGKAKLESLIPTVHPDSQTNIWAALELINRLASAKEFEGRNVVAALLTDGMPNVDPPRGILPSYRNLKKPAMFSLSTFGFGYRLDSNILSELATLGGGSFGFIPDYSMVATVFINWAAGMLSTASTSQCIVVKHTDGSSSTLETGPIQIGQGRNIIIPVTKSIASITLGGNTVVPEERRVSEMLLARNDLIDAIKNCIHQGGVQLFSGLYEKYADTEARELVRDVMPSQDDSEVGQVILAPKHYDTWGKHYLRAYLRAQELQQCMNFKDSGLQIYGGDSFHELQKVGDEVFMHLPPLEATGYKTQPTNYTVTQPPVNMANVFNNPRGGCWAPGSKVFMADLSEKAIECVQRGDKIWGLTGPATVEYVVELGTVEDTQPMVKLGDLWITPWHPVLHGPTWTFPANLAPIVNCKMPKVYNLVLDKSHIVNISGILSVTLGHGFKGPVIQHEFFGDKECILRDLAAQPGFAEGRPVFRNLASLKENGLVIGWYDS